MNINKTLKMFRKKYMGKCLSFRARQTWHPKHGEWWWRESDGEGQRGGEGEREGGRGNFCAL